MKFNLSIFQAFMLLLASFLAAGCSKNTADVAAPNQEAELFGPYPVVKVTDGDTFRVLINGEKVRIRPIGIDTPETVHPSKPVQCFGPESSDYAEELLLDSSVYLEYDESQAIFGKHGRTLAHVWTEDKKLYASQAIADGFGFEYTYDADYKYKQLYLADQRKAKANSAGLWGSCPKSGQKPRN
jgi:micrococcal nuclease